MKTYKVRIMWNERGGTLAHINGEIEWEREDAHSVPRLVCENGAKVEIDKSRLKDACDDGVDFIYESPGFTRLSMRRSEPPQ